MCVCLSVCVWLVSSIIHQFKYDYYTDSINDWVDNLLGLGTLRHRNDFDFDLAFLLNYLSILVLHLSKTMRYCLLLAFTVTSTITFTIHEKERERFSR